MGVRGLTTYLRDHKTRLSKHVEFVQHSDSEPVPLVVDGWSFIYKLCLDTDLPWVYGGEYDEFCAAVKNVVKAWQEVGLKPIFVFDGPSPEKKFTTIISRLNQSHVQNSVLFFRTSPVSRSSRRFLHENRIIPPQILDVCVHALRSTSDPERPEPRSVEVHFADEEADSFAVELAGRVHGYITGNDSDFVVLNCDGYEGFIPLDEMIWTTPVDEELPSSADKDFFQTVKSKKKPPTSSTVFSGTLPPANFAGVALSATVYTPNMLAKYLDLPTSLLPLLGALVGNDYTAQPTASTASIYSPTATPRSSPPPSTKSFQNLLFERGSTPSRKIESTAATMRRVLNPTAGGKKRAAPSSVVELIQLTVESLLEDSRPPQGFVASGQQDIIVETVVEGTLPYAIAAPPAVEELDPSVCLLHRPFDCFLRSIFSQFESDENRTQLAARYLDAYRSGKLSPSLVDVLSTATYWPEIFLESPDIESVGRSLFRDIRIFGYALLDHGLGIPSPAEEEEEEVIENGVDLDNAQEKSSEGEDGDEVIDVVESDSNSEDDDDDDVSSTLSEVDKLRGALRDLSFDEDEDDEEPDIADKVDQNAKSALRTRGTSNPQLRTTKRAPTFVTEYVRRGARVANEAIQVPFLSTFGFLDSLCEDIENGIPLPLRGTELRLAAFLAFFESDTAEIRKIPAEDLQCVLVLRYTVSQLHLRASAVAQAGAAAEREKEKWTAREARAFLLAVRSDAHLGSDDERRRRRRREKLQSLPPPPEHVSERSIQLGAQVQMGAESVAHLAQILLLADAVPSFAHRFSGRLFHALLAQPEGALMELMDDGDDGDALWAAATAGLADRFAEERKKMRRREKARPAGAKSAAPSLVDGRAKRTGMFGMLSDMVDADDD